MPAFTLRPLLPSDRPFVRLFMSEHWGAPQIVSRGQVYEPENFPGFLVERDGLPAGLLTYRIDGLECEILTLDSLVGGQGVGSALIAAARQAAQQAGCRRLWLITTNDNMPALRFYQKRGFRLAALHRDALELSRRLKPQIPLLGLGGIPLRDELELEYLLEEEYP